MSKKIVIYTQNHCVYCVLAKRLLAQRGVSFHEIFLEDGNDQAWKELMAQSGMKTLPQIFCDDQLLGGYRELMLQDSQDALLSLK